MQIIIPLLLAALVCCSLFSGFGIYESFVKGAKKSLSVMVSILPFMAAMLCALNIFRDSGALAMLIDILSPALNFFNIPTELTTLILLRPFSGSAAVALLSDVFTTTGVDSYHSFLASVMLGSTETIFYTVALYFGSINVTKTRHAIPVAIISGLIGLIFSCILSNIFYY